MEHSTGPGDAFRLLRLRFLRPPPQTIFLSNLKSSNVAFEVAVGITDDYGTEVDSLFESLDLSLSIVDSTINLPYRNATLSFSENSNSPSNFTIHSSRGHFHTLKLVITFTSTLSKSISFPPVRLLLKVAERKGQTTQKSSPGSERMKELIGEVEQEAKESWDSTNLIFMRVLSGDIEVIGSGKKESSVSSSKVQTAIRTLYIPSTCTSINTTLQAIERPGLNNSTGSRLWDCAIGLSCFLSLHPEYLLSLLTDSEATAPASASISTSRRTRIIEVGSGCGIASSFALKLIQNLNNSKSNSEKYRVTVVATDIEATVESTLKENLSINFPPPATREKDSTISEIRSEVLNWGVLSEAEKELYLGKDDAEQDITILGSDILYDPDTHLDLLQTINSLLGSTISNVLIQGSLDTTSHQQLNSRRKAIIAYKARTEGDDGFFTLAKESGRRVEKVWQWGEIQVWCIA